MKLDLYGNVGVIEYLIVLLNPKKVIWRRLSRGRYHEIKPDGDGLHGDGLLRSRVFRGLWLDPAALWNPKRSVRKAVQKGIRSPEHTAFVRRLAAKVRR